MDEAVRERCHTKCKFGTVMRVVSEQTMEVDGMPRHVRDLRSAVPPETAPTPGQTFMSDDEDFRCFLRVVDQRESLLTAMKNQTALHPGEAAEKSDSRIVTNFDDYDVLIIRGSVVSRETCKQSRLTEGMNFWT